MNHPLEYRAHYNHLGKVCHCPWGRRDGSEHLGSVKEASKFEWLQGRPDMQQERNKWWLDWMQRNGFVSDETDKMLPWLHREFKKGRLLPSERMRTLKYRVDGSPWNDADFDNPPPDVVTVGGPGQENLFPSTIATMQAHLDEMKKRGRGLDVMQHQVHELTPKVHEFADWKHNQERRDLGEVIHRFDDGWTIRRLQNAEEHKDEGDQMGHCIGTHSYGYADKTDAGDMIYASLRDHKNIPHATLEMTPDHWKHNETDEEFYHHPGFTPDQGWIPQVGPSTKIEQFYGKEDQDPLPEYQERVNEWLAPHGIDADIYDDVAQVQPAYDVSSYMDIHGEDGGFHEYVDPEARIGENTEYDFNIPDWGQIAEDYVQDHNDYVDEARQGFFDTMRQRYDIPSFEEELYNRYPDDQEVLGQWEQLKEPYYHPYTGEFVQGYGGSPLEEFQNKLFREVPMMNRLPQSPIGDHSVMRPAGPPTSPWVYSKSIAPLYYRWVFSPAKGVTLGKNDDDHPALVKYHQNLGGEIDGQNLSSGYAYPIGNGWRLTNYEHQPVGDPFIVNQVVRALNHENGPEIRSEGSWQPSEYDWNRIHYGLPKEKIVI